MLILGLAVATFTVRFGGLLLGEKLPQTGPIARGLKALPGCMIVALVAVSLTSGGQNEWLAALAAGATALASRSLPLTMLVGIAAIYLLRTMA